MVIDAELEFNRSIRPNHRDNFRDSSGLGVLKTTGKYEFRDASDPTKLRSKLVPRKMRLKKMMTVRGLGELVCYAFVRPQAGFGNLKIFY